MQLDYSQIGRRIAACRKARGLTQEQLSELVDISNTYMSSIERAVSIPSTEVIMRLAIALDTTPDEFLTGTARRGTERWQDVAQRLRTLNERQLDLTDSFLDWLTAQKLDEL